MEEFLTLILTRMELAKGRMSLKLTKLNGQIQDAAYANEAPVAHPIGFVYNPPEEEYEEEEED